VQVAGRSSEVVVVGGGIIGLACAWRIAQTGRSVVVLDRGEPGAGASWAAAGMLAPVAEAEFGEDAHLRINRDGAALWPAFAAELAERTGVDLEYRRTGSLVVAIDADDVEELRRLYELRRGLGLDTEWLTGRDCRRLEAGLSPRVRGGMLAPDDGQVDPRAVVRALREAVEREGGEIRTGIAVEAAEESGGEVTGVRLADGEVVPGATVVLAAGAWSAALGTVDPPPPVRPVKGQILRLRGTPGQPLAARVVWTPRCYVVCRPSGEIVIGSTVEERGFDTTVTAGGVRELLEDAWEVLPDIDERELVETRAGLRPGTPDNLPVIGAASTAGLLWATGHYRNGVLLAPITADAIARLVRGDDVPPALAEFSPARLAGGQHLAGSTA
jgi:glycine oxidase